MRSIRRILLVGVALLFLVVGLLFLGGRVLGCLGPLGVTHVQCIAAFNITNEPDYSPGPPEGAWITVGLASVLMTLAILPWPLPSIRVVAGLLVPGAVGAILGAAVYELTRETSLSGPTSSGKVITVFFAPNDAARAMDAAIGAGVAILVAAIALTARAAPTRPLTRSREPASTAPRTPPPTNDSADGAPADGRGRSATSCEDALTRARTRNPGCRPPPASTTTSPP